MPWGCQAHQCVQPETTVRSHEQAVQRLTSGCDWLSDCACGRSACAAEEPSLPRLPHCRQQQLWVQRARAVSTPTHCAERRNSSSSLVLTSGGGSSSAGWISEACVHPLPASGGFLACLLAAPSMRHKACRPPILQRCQSPTAALQQPGPAAAVPRSGPAAWRGAAGHTKLLPRAAAVLSQPQTAMPPAQPGPGQPVWVGCRHRLQQAMAAPAAVTESASSAQAGKTLLQPSGPCLASRLQLRAQPGQFSRSHEDLGVLSCGLTGPSDTFCTHRGLSGGACIWSSSSPAAAQASPPSRRPRAGPPRPAGMNRAVSTWCRARNRRWCARSHLIDDSLGRDLHGLHLGRHAVLVLPGLGVGGRRPRVLHTQGSSSPHAISCRILRSGLAFKGVPVSVLALCCQGCSTGGGCGAPRRQGPLCPRRSAQAPSCLPARQSN